MVYESSRGRLSINGPYCHSILIGFTDLPVNWSRIFLWVSVVGVRRTADVRNGGVGYRNRRGCPATHRDGSRGPRDAGKSMPGLARSTAKRSGVA